MLTMNQIENFSKLKRPDKKDRDDIVYTAKTLLTYMEMIANTIDVSIDTRSITLDYLLNGIRLLMGAEARFKDAEGRAKAIEVAVVGRLGGAVQGQPTSSINYLQRIDELREVEKKWLKWREMLNKMNTEKL